MSAEVTKMAYMNREPWHGLGEKLTDGGDIDLWTTEAGLDWAALKTQLMFQPTAESGVIPYKNRFALSRSDTNFELSIVGEPYKVVQPRHVMGFFREYVEKLEGFTMECAGCLYHGRKIWALAKSVQGEHRVLGGDDTLDRYLLLATSYDLTLPTIVQQTSIRVVCKNTLMAAFGEGRAGREPQLIISHKSAFDEEAIKQRMALDDQWGGFTTLINALAEKKMTEEAVEKFYLDLYYTAAQQEAAEFSSKAANRKIGQIMTTYLEAPGQKLGSASGTAWGALNGLTYFIDHQAKSQTPDSKLDKAWFGEGNTLKRLALRRLNQLVTI